VALLAKDPKIIPKPISTLDLAGVKLSAEEGFVWSRVDGRLSVEEISVVTGMQEDRIWDVLVKLFEVKLINLPGFDRPTRPAPSPQAAEPKIREAAPTDPDPRPPSAVTESIEQPAATEAAADGATDAESEQETLAAAEAALKAEAEPQEDDEEVDLKPKVRAEIDSYFNKLDVVDFYNALDVHRSTDPREIVRAYKRKSKKFHPDRYFGKNLGSYKNKLEEVFKYLTQVKDLLCDPQRRAQYDESLAADDALAQELEAAAELEEAAIAAQEEVEEEIAGGIAGDAPESALAAEEAPPAEALPRRPPPRRKKKRTTLRFRALAARLGKQPYPPTPPHGTAAVGEQSPQETDRARRRRKQAAARRSYAVLKAAAQSRMVKAAEHYEDGMQKLLNKNYIAASASLKMATVFDPDNEEYQKKHKVAADRAGEILAEQDRKQARFHASVGRWEAAGRAFAKAADHHPTARHCIDAAEALVNAGELREAQQYAIKATELEPENVQARVVLASVYKEAGMLHNARRELEHALGLDADDKAAKKLMREVRKSL
jgi:curved DNA-binding protein CbpA